MGLSLYKANAADNIISVYLPYNPCRELIICQAKARSGKTLFNFTTMKPQYQFSRNWHTFDVWSTPITIGHAIDWCIEHFGEAPIAPDAWSRWVYSGFQFKFRDEDDYLLFLLRWR